ncbi:HNH endonuclease (plasmid) [Halomonas sp. KO116]|uniref:HNH endonuclease n=2 Tax=Oceanospirillales TaxID=135619 RepID=A0A7Z0LV47_9GAMM|nr:HNH endonuclease [Halomonas sp. KO116]NYS79176.1 HNH endonuclease [Halomonas glaciei]
MLKSMLKIAQNTINSKTGSGYRKIYLSRYQQDEHACAGCKSTFPTSRIQVDHIIPQKHGGSNAITNLQAMCAPCNNAKSAKIDQLALKYSGAALVREIKKIYR